MPRNLPPLADDFGKEVARANDLARRLERARVLLAGKADTRHILHVSRLELVYELAYLRIFIAWENFLEQAFFRYLCGYQHSGGREVIWSPQYYGTLADAELALLGHRQYVLWHNPNLVVTRAQQFFDNGRHETVISSNLARLEHLAFIRHRIAHSQEHSKRNFDIATMMFCGKRYPGSRPGRFLRDQDLRTPPPNRWLEIVSDEFLGLAQQICP